MITWKGILSQLQKAFAPLDYTCDNCGVETFGDNLCNDCKSKLSRPTMRCPRCGRRTKRPEICYECKAHAPTYDQAVSPFVYEGTAASLINKFKLGEPYLKYFFAKEMSESVKALGQIDIITYVPMTKKAVFDRGYNQAEILAKQTGKLLNLPVEELLKKKRDTSEQKSLNREQRIKNLQGCFCLTNKKQVKDKIVLVIDDVMTTGTTTETITTLLKQAGAKKVYASTVAAVAYELKRK